MAITAVPVAQWLFNEAASGDAITTVADNITSPSAADLTRNAGTGTGAWGTIGAGRGYSFASATSGFYFRKTISGSKLALSGKKKIAVQFVAVFAGANGAGAPIFSVGGDADFLIRHSGNTSAIELFFHVSDTRLRTIAPGVITAGVPVVLTFVTDTTQVTANDRHRIYIGTSTPSVTVNANLAQDATLSTWGDSLDIGELASESLGQWKGGIAYAAIYVDGEVDKLVAELADHVTALEADNDVAPGTGGGAEEDIELDPGIGAETDSALARTVAKQRATGVATETDSAQTVTLSRRISTGLATETDAAQARAVSKAIAAGVATETESAHGPLVAKQRANETDVALAPSALSRLLPTGIGAETDAAVARALAKHLSPGVAAETDAAVAPTVTAGLSTGAAAETDAALSRALSKRLSTGQATEADAALPLDLTSGLTTAASVEVDSALARTLTKQIAAPGVATESDSGVTRTLQKRISGLPSVETAVALSLTLSRALAMGRAAETDSARAPGLQLTAGRANETDLALALTLTSGLSFVGVRLETSEAFALRYSNLEDLALRYDCSETLELP